MSESLASPWISDYLIDIAENYGAQIYNAPISKKKRRVQLTDFLTYQENSYIWAWISDKEYRVSVRIAKEAVDQYNSTHSPPLIISRFYPAFIGDYRPMFAPRPLGANMVGNTSVSHLSLEVGFIKQIGPGTHLFGSPRDLESNEKLKVWILGLRQDGGGGNILKLRKQDEAARSKNPPASPKPQPRLVPQAPASSKPAAKVPDTAKTKPARPQDFRRAYDKRWRTIELDPWKFAVKRAVEEPFKEVVIAPPPIELPTESTSETALRRPTRTPSPKPVSQPGTPTDWSVSNRGSPISLHEAHTHAPENHEQQQEEAGVLPTTAQLPSDAERVTMESVGVVTSQETGSVQPPTPAQRIKRSPQPRSSSPPRSAPERSVRSPPRPSQQSLHSSPPLPSSSLPPLSSSLPLPVGIRKNIQRKVPRPEVPPPRPDANKDGPAQILVPNSDTSGTASSQSYSQSQRSQPRSQPHAPALPSSLAKEFKPPYASTPKVQTPRRTLKMFAEPLPVLSDIEEQSTTSADDVHTTEKDDVDTREQKRPKSNGLPAPSAPQIEVLRVNESGTEEEIDELQLTHSTRTEVEADTWTSVQDKGDGSAHADADREDNQLSDDDAEIDSRLQPLPPQPSSPPTASAKPQLSPKKPSTNGTSPRPSEKPLSQSSMHSLFSDSLGEEQTLPSQAPPAAAEVALRTEHESKAETKPSHVPTHDPDAWKEPSFMSRNKGKGKARAFEQEPEIFVMKAGKKRLRCAHPESPVAKRRKVVPVEEPGTSGSREGKIRSNERPSATPTDATKATSQSQQSKRRLVNFLFDSEKIDMSEGVPMPRLEWKTDILSSLLRTGRIRTLGDSVVQDGSVYIDEDKYAR